MNECSYEYKDKASTCETVESEAKMNRNAYVQKRKRGWPWKEM